MLRATLVSPRNFKMEEVPKPAAEKGEVIIKIERTGICGSDIHAYYGKHPFIDLPVTLGHEFAGVVADVGGGVQDLAVGDRVTVMPQIYCGECHNCRSGRYNICSSLKVIGCQCDGSNQQYLSVDSRAVVKLPDGMSFDQGAMLEPVAVGIHACKRAGVEGKKVVVQGAGTIGNLTAQAARAMGAGAVMITDISQYRLDLAERCGIEYCVDAGTDGLKAEVKRIWGKDGADVIIECVGVASTIEQAIHAARKGTDIIVAGVFEEKAAINLGLVQDKELRLIGTLMYTEDSWKDAIEFVVSGKIKPEPLINCHFKLSELPNAYKYIEDNRDIATKVLVDA